MNRASSYEFKDVKRMRRDNSIAHAITKQQQQPNRQPLTVFKSSDKEGLNNQVFNSQLTNRLNNKENMPTKFQSLAGKENLPSSQIQFSKCGPTVPQVQSTFRIFVDDDASDGVVNQSKQKDQSEIKENVHPLRQKLINKENVIPQLQAPKIEPLGQKSLRVDDVSSNKIEVVESADQLDSKMEVVTALIKPSLASIPIPKVHNDDSLLCEESSMAISPQNDELSEGPKKRPNNKRKSNSLCEVDIYADDIHSYLRKAECFHRPKCDYMDKQCDVNATMRSILVDWLVEVGEEYKLRDRTLYLAISYIDRFLSAMSVRRSKLQLVGTAALFIAAYQFISC